MTMYASSNPNGPATASTSTVGGIPPGLHASRSRESTGETGSSGSTIPPVPGVGGVRCYWALLRPSFPSVSDPGSRFELTFVHFDPVLSVHLRRERLSMLGRGVIEFIHPTEREQARKDLAGAIAVDDLQGSVTRVRYARLSRIRQLLGCSPEDLDVPAVMEKIAEDKDYLILDLVLNWAADGLLLGFFHAIRDVDPRMNNDPAGKHLAWSNWCGTEHMPEDIEAISQNIAMALPVPRRSRHPPQRVFQVHTTEAAVTRPNSTVFSWPPPRPESNRADPQMPFGDGMYDAEEYKYLMKGVDMDPSSMTAPEDTRTNCTTRFGAKHSLNSEGVFRQINSVFIPYGSLIFSCFQTTQTIDQSQEARQEVTNPFGLPEGYDYQTSNGPSAIEPALQDGPWQPPLQTYNGFPGKPIIDPSATLLGKRHRDIAGEDFEWGSSASQAPTLGNHHYPPVPSTYHPHAPLHEAGSSRYHHGSQQAPTYPPQAEYMQQQDPAQYMYNANSFAQSTSYQAVSHARGASPSEHEGLALETRMPFVAPQGSYPAPAPTMASIPSNGPPHPVYAAQPHASRRDEPGLASPTTKTASQQQQAAEKAASSRPLVKPPKGVTCCRACGTVDSPEWRKSESGIKDLCNACGLRLARAQAKKEGRQKPRKKKEKVETSPT